MSIYNIEIETMNGEIKKMKEYEGNVLLIVNTASKCGFTPQFDGLEHLHSEFFDKGLRILGFPCNQFLNQDPGTNEEILEFCSVNFGVTFEMFKKLNVKGKNIHPLYDYLIKNAPDRVGKKVKWNFEKFLVSREGYLIGRYLPRVKPEDLTSDIIKAL